MRRSEETSRSSANRMPLHLTVAAKELLRLATWSSFSDIVLRRIVSAILSLNTSAMEVTLRETVGDGCEIARTFYRSEMWRPEVHRRPRAS